MKRELFLILLFGSASLLSAYKPHAEKFNNLIVFYVENSKGGGSVALSPQLIERLDNEVKACKGKADNKFLLYWSNDQKSDYSKKPENCTKIINSLFEKNSRTPNALLDKSMMRNILFDKEFSLKGNITINYFLTDNYILDYAMRDEPSVLTGMFPSEVAFISGISETLVTVNIYYSNKDNKINMDNFRQANNLNNKSKITYNYIQVN